MPGKTRGRCYTDSDGHDHPWTTRKIVNNSVYLLRYCVSGQKCKTEGGPYLPFSDFYKNEKGPEGFSYKCKKCSSAYLAAYQTERDAIKVKRASYGPRSGYDLHEENGLLVKRCTRGADCINALQPNIPLDQFAKNARAADGYMAYCKLCDAKKQREYYHKRHGTSPPIVEIKPMAEDNHTLVLPTPDFISKRSGTFWELSTVARVVGVPEYSLRQQHGTIVKKYENQSVVDAESFQIMWDREQANRAFRRLQGEREAARLVAAKAAEDPQILRAPPSHDSLVYRFNAARRGLQRIYHAIMGGKVVMKDPDTLKLLMDDMKDAGAFGEEDISE